MTFANIFSWCQSTQTQLIDYEADTYCKLDKLSDGQHPLESRLFSIKASTATLSVLFFEYLKNFNYNIILKDLDVKSLVGRVAIMTLYEVFCATPSLLVFPVQFFILSTLGLLNPKSIHATSDKIPKPPK